ncbi:MAG: ABC transporter ATP-binding protein [Eubacteriales bacterium]|nr:ABC transporter ATP-binding protein [Eubacteriales bacterium]
MAHKKDVKINQNKYKLEPDLAQRHAELLEALASVEDEETLPKLNGNVWRQFFKLGQPGRYLYLWLVLIMAVLAIFDNLSPLFVRFSLDHFVALGTSKGLALYALAFALLILGQAFFDRLFMLLAGKIETNMAFNIRERGLKKLLKLDFSYYDRTAVGWILARMIHDVTNVTEVLAWAMTDLIWCISTIALISIVMFCLNWRLSLLVLTALPLAIFIFKYFQSRILKEQREVKKVNSAITAAYNEGIVGAKTSKTLALAAPMQDEFDFLTSHFADRSIASSRLSYRFGPIIGFMGVLTAALILAIGGKFVQSDLVSLGTMITFFIYSLKIWGPLANVADIVTDFQAAQAAIERVLHIFAEESKISDSPEVLARYGARDGEGREAWPEFKGKIEFRNVSFSYVEGEPILENFNLTIEAGEQIALVGETGAGKSTLVNLACRFYEPQSGQILFDGVDYREYPLNWLYSNLAYVLQTPQLFSGTIAENIRYGRLDASDEDVKKAARLVNAEDFILRREAGYEAPVGESGGLLSTGEKQLISFARAVISNPAFFVLDEATSSIDTETEKEIQKAIEQLLAGRTALIIAHRLSTIKNVDRIIVIEDGKIIEDGTHDSLMAKAGVYHTFYSGQFKLE